MFCFVAGILLYIRFHGGSASVIRLVFSVRGLLVPADADLNRITCIADSIRQLISVLDIFRLLALSPIIESLTVPGLVGHEI